MRKMSIISLALLVAILVAHQYEAKSRYLVVALDYCDQVDAYTQARTQVGDSAYCQRRERRDVCERLLRLGLSVIPEELQKECETIAEESPDWIELFKRFLSYVQWHEGVYSRIVLNQTTLQETRTLTYNCDIFKRCTGLGATVKAIATGILTAMYTKRFFVADQLSFQSASCWTDLTILSNTINWKVDIPTWDSLQDKIKVKYHVVNVSYSTRNVHVFYAYPSIGFDEFFCEDLPKVERNFATDTLCKEGMKRNAEEFLLGRKHTHFVLGAITRAAMHFSKAVSEQTNQKLIALQKIGLPSNGYLAVHLRTGMNELLPTKSKAGKYYKSGKFIQGDAKWTQHIDCALQRADASGLARPILLVTDASTPRKWTRAHYRTEDVLVTNSSFFHFSKEAHKSPRAAEFSKVAHHNLNSSRSGMDKPFQVKDMVSEMELLSRASTIIPSTMSSFSEAAFYFSALPQSQLSPC